MEGTFNIYQRVAYGLGLLTCNRTIEAGFIRVQPSCGFISKLAAPYSIIPEPIQLCSLPVNLVDISRVSLGLLTCLQCNRGPCTEALRCSWHYLHVVVVTIDGQTLSDMLTDQDDKWHACPLVMLIHNYATEAVVSQRAAMCARVDRNGAIATLIRPS